MHQICVHAQACEVSVRTVVEVARLALERKCFRKHAVRVGVFAVFDKASASYSRSYVAGNYVSENGERVVAHFAFARRAEAPYRTVSRAVVVSDFVERAPGTFFKQSAVIHCVVKPARGASVGVTAQRDRRARGHVPVEHYLIISVVYTARERFVYRKKGVPQHCEFVYFVLFDAAHIRGRIHFARGSQKLTVFRVEHGYYAGRVAQIGVEVFGRGNAEYVVRGFDRSRYRKIYVRIAV